jgi:hypothetical protein
MAAVIFSGMIFLKGLKSGNIKTIPGTWSDVAAAAVTWGVAATSDFQVSEDSILYDAVLNVGGTDTLKDDIIVNDAYSGIYLDHKSNLNTAQVRQFMQSPQYIKGGSRIRLLQRA